MWLADAQQHQVNKNLAKKTTLVLSWKHHWTAHTNSTPASTLSEDILWQWLFRQGFKEKAMSHLRKDWVDGHIT